jgi:hypothetical protein
MIAMSNLLQIKELEPQQQQLHGENVRKFVAALCR